MVLKSGSLAPVNLTASADSIDPKTSIYSTDPKTSIYSTDLRASIYSTDLRASIYSTDLRASIYFTALNLSVVLDPDTLNRYIRGDEVSFQDSSYIVTGKVNSDVVLTTDLLALDIGTIAADNVDIGDELSLTVDYSRQFADSTAINDEAVRAFGKLAYDTAALQDIFSAVFNKALADNYSVSDSAALSTTTTALNAVTASDLFTRVVTYNRALTDAVSLDDNATVGGVEKETQANKNNVFSIVEEQQFSISKTAEEDVVPSDDVFALLVARLVDDEVSLTEEIIIVNRSLASSVLNANALNIGAFNI
jgi:hypothetical protein